MRKGADPRTGNGFVGCGLDIMREGKPVKAAMAGQTNIRMLGSERLTYYRDTVVAVRVNVRPLKEARLYIPCVS